jgi:hypothetical protein
VKEDGPPTSRKQPLAHSLVSRQGAEGPRPGGTPAPGHLGPVKSAGEVNLERDLLQVGAGNIEVPKLFCPPTILGDGPIIFPESPFNTWGQIGNM